MSPIYLHQHFFDFTPDAEYFTSNDCVYSINNRLSIIGLAFYDFYHAKMIDLIQTAKSKSDKLIVYIKEPFSTDLVDLVTQFESDKDIMFFGDMIPNFECTNWQTAVSWFVSPRHYYQIDDWAKNLLSKIDDTDLVKPYKFDCLLGCRRGHRDIIEQYHENSAYKDNFIFNYFKDDIRNGIWNLDIGDTRATWESLTVFDHYDVALSCLIPYYIYNQSYHSVVAESTTFNEFNHVTEKVAKPMMAKRLFVMFAGQFYLRSLRKLGFRTFDDVIDESYDLEPDSTKRYEMAWHQVEQLCVQDPVQIRHSIMPVLEHNRNHFLNSDWHKPVKSHISWCKKQLQI